MSRLKYFDGTNWNEVGGNIAGDTLPIGVIVPYGSATAPTNWLVCDGSAVSRTTYAELFSAIGTTFGAGDGSTTFNLPNLKGRVPVGQDASDSDFNDIGETGGEKTHTLVAAEVPQLTFDTWVSRPVATQGGYADGNWFAYGSNEDHVQQHGSKITTNAGDGAHNNLQPYQVVCYIIKAKQSAGVVGNVLNESSNSTTDTYCCDYINGTEIWANTNPTSSFAGQDINEDLSGYSYLDIYCLRYIADDQSVLHFKVLLDSTYSTSQLFYVDYSNGVRSWNRTLSWTSSKITFGNNTINGSTNNSGLVPYKIIGHK